MAAAVMMGSWRHRGGRDRIGIGVSYWRRSGVDFDLIAAQNSFVMAYDAILDDAGRLGPRMRCRWPNRSRIRCKKALLYLKAGHQNVTIK